MMLKDIVSLARLDLDDAVEPFLWKDADLLRFGNEAEREAAARGRLIVDSSTDDVTRIVTRASVASYDLDPRVIFVRRVKSSLSSNPLAKVRYRDLDAEDPGWEDRAGGSVDRYSLDFQTGKILLVSCPSASILPIVRLTVVRLPLEDMQADDEPEISPAHHSELRHWIVYRGFSMPDEELYRPDAAKLALAHYERRFGPPLTALDQQWINTNHGYDGDEGLF